VPLSKVPLSRVPLSKGSLDKGALGRVLPGEELIPAEKAELMLELEDALGRMARAHGRASRAVELYYFGGLTLAEIGEVLGVSAATAMRDLRFAKAWLAREWGGAE
jgi:RNA polymerase sigma factor (sigma-70 family)